MDELTLESTIDGMLSVDYKKRFIAEYNQVKIRLKKLDKTLSDYHDGTLKFKLDSGIELLTFQSNAMNRYLQILEERALREDISL